jgi:hypothetical protein
MSHPVTRGPMYGQEKLQSTLVVMLDYIYISLFFFCTQQIGKHSICY